MITGSNVQDVDACPTREVLPQGEERGDQAERGNELHAFCQAVTINPARREKALEAVSEEYRHTAAGINLDVVLDGIRVDGCEVAFALNVKTKTCRKIGENINRNYGPLAPYEIAFTVDLLGWSEVLDCPVELDYKSGMSIGPVAEHGQRRICAAGLMLFYGSDTAISRVAYIRDNGDIVPDGHEFSLMDAWEICDAAVVTVDKVAAAMKVAATGVIPPVNADRDKQCKYCRAFDSCPYWTNLARGVLSGRETIPTMADLEKMDPEQLGVIFDKAKEVGKVLEILEDKLKEFVKRGVTLPVGSGKAYVVQDNAGKAYFDASAARGLIHTLLGRLGMSDDDIANEIKKLTKPGAPYVSVVKRKVQLPVLAKAS